MTTKGEGEHFVGGLLAGAGLFIGASYFLHCKCGLGPWKCQSTDPRHQANRGGPASLDASDDCGCGRPAKKRRRGRGRRR